MGQRNDSSLVSDCEWHNESGVFRESLETDPFVEYNSVEMTATHLKRFDKWTRAMPETGFISGVRLNMCKNLIYR